ncbi:hypothetical protein CEXT_639311 [Caerostris extrusa]|uniref:Uncharacterized protein n=1 Tax=Caerostris extrusa TaxID=172846 RepID=A0AAV4X046_CAEEX|nr:hypothetical protein CEXT_639311 [Caerostris extrusa]
MVSQAHTALGRKQSESGTHLESDSPATRLKRDQLGCSPWQSITYLVLLYRVDFLLRDWQKIAEIGWMPRASMTMLHNFAINERLHGLLSAMVGSGYWLFLYTCGR